MPALFYIIRNRLRRWRRTTAQLRSEAYARTATEAFPIYPFNPEG